MRITSTITGDRATIKQLRGLPDVARQAVALTAEEVEEYVEGEAGRHSKSGSLFASILKRREGDTWIVEHDLQRARHALFVHWGTRPHKIEPRLKKVLRWPGGGRFIFAKLVNHPGNKPDPWMVRAAALAPVMFQRHVEALLAKREEG